MFLTLLGTGCPSVNKDRFGPANLIHTNKTKILIDCGSGVTQRLLQAGFKGSDVDYLLLTHLHSDHVVDFYQLIISSWHQYRKRKWNIIGPKGTKKFLYSLMSTWKKERNARIKFEKRKSIEGFKLNIIEINNDNYFMINDIKVEYFKVDHKPVIHAFGYNFINKNKKITISGDTKPCKNLDRFAFNSDILLHEVFIEDEIIPERGIRSSETVHNVKSYHTTSRQVGKIAKKVRAKNLVLTHFVPPVFNENKLRKLVKKDYGKSPILGQDLMTLDINGNIV
tara:strand:+ start:608 stop:1450 length:843 start_codon:yes stop_codon:yes gene_type:complete